ncbi:MAG: ABC transporter permease [Nitrospirae bacterium]|nr:ABC transporter permease [Nitrospirota bacterium]
MGTGGKHHRLALISGVVLGVIGLAAAAAPWLAPYPFDAQDPGRLLQSPGVDHWLGTDRLGRDLLSRLIYGARVSMTLGVSSAVIATLLGIAYGLASGYLGGRTDNLLMRLLDVIYALPDLLLIILLTIVLGRGLTGMIAALSLVSWVTVARLVRGEVLRLKSADYLDAARALGAGHLRIVLVHLLPMMLGPLLVTLSFRIPAAILAESTLSFVGIGLAPPTPSWGGMANDGWAALRFYPHVIIVPSVAIAVTILTFNILGDYLNDRLNPRRASIAGRESSA